MRKSLLVVLLLSALAVIAIGTVPVLADDEAPGAYLALGDSVPFGFNPLVTVAQRVNPHVFVGYPEAFAGQDHLAVTNLSCPGETSGSLISSAQTDNGCGRYRSHFPLHAAYSGPQLAAGVSFLQSHSNTQLVTISIGHNDLLLLEKACNNVYSCEEAGLPAMLNQLDQNLVTIFTSIRAVGYEGRLVAVTYYAQNYRNPQEVALIKSVDQTLAAAVRQFDGQAASGFRAFRKASREFDGDSCAAGLLIVVNALPLTCDSHPSPDGRELLASSIRMAVDRP